MVDELDSLESLIKIFRFYEKMLDYMGNFIIYFTREANLKYY